MIYSQLVRNTGDDLDLSLTYERGGKGSLVRLRPVPVGSVSNSRQLELFGNIHIWCQKCGKSGSSVRIKKNKVFFFFTHDT